MVDEPLERRCAQSPRAAADFTAMATIFSEAARGSVAAQSLLLDHMIIEMLRPDAISNEFLGGVELLARLLASHGRPEDEIRLATFLTFKGDMARQAAGSALGAALFAEGLSILRNLIAAGNVEAGEHYDLLSRLIDEESSIPGDLLIADREAAMH